MFLTLLHDLETCSPARTRGARQAKKGSKGNVIECLLMKERHNDKASMMNFRRRGVGQTVINKTDVTKIAGDRRKGCVVEQSLADLMENEKYVNYNVKLRCEDVNSRDCLMVFHMMRLTNDKYRTLAKKRASLVEAHADVKTADGHKNKEFYIGKSRKKRLIKKTNYAQQLLKIQSVTIEAVSSEADRRTSTALPSASRTRRCRGTPTRGVRWSFRSRTSPSGKTRF